MNLLPAVIFFLGYLWIETTHPSNPKYMSWSVVVWFLGTACLAFLGCTVGAIK